MAKFVERDASQRCLLPPDLRDWVPEDDLAHFVLEAVERIPMRAFKVNERGRGSAQYHLRMMLALVICCYANRGVRVAPKPGTAYGYYFGVLS